MTAGAVVGRAATTEDEARALLRARQGAGARYDSVDAPGRDLAWARREAAGRLYNVQEFAEEIAAAAVEPIPADHTRLVGDVSSFTPIPGE